MTIPNLFYFSQLLGQVLKERKLKLAVAESCTAGGLAEQITAVSGSSHWLERGFITYSNESKIQMLGVNPKTLDKFGAVSQETAKEMAIGVINHSDADISLSITGIAGPEGGDEKKPVGLVWFGLAHKQGKADTRNAYFFSGRKNVRDCSIAFALQWLLEDLSVKF